jgi:carbon-monoxide dehydrogenase medium subunit
MGNTPLRAREVERALQGKPADQIRSAAEKAAEGTNPQQDLNGSPDYRRHLATVLTRRALEEITGQH